MRNKAVLIGLTFLFVFLGLVPTIAQDLHRWEERQRIVGQEEKQNFIFEDMDIPIKRPHYPLFHKENIKTLEAIIPDFQVNENAGPYGAGQVSPSIAVDGSGNFVITWMDGRNGYPPGDIYAHRYLSDGTTEESNFKVNDNEENASPGNPSISTDGSGNFVVVWGDNRNGDRDIYTQRYSSDGTAAGINFKVNDDEGNAQQRSPSIAVDGNGNFVVVWVDNRNGDVDIYAQRYSSDGTAAGSNFKVNDDEGSTYQDSPSISMDGNGNFVVVWGDGRNSNGDIYAQQYSSDGTAVGINLKVNDDEENASQGHPSISMDGSGNYVITWEDGRNSDFDIYAQRYSSNGTALGNNFKINDDEGSAYQWSPSISTDGSGNFVITWADNRNDFSDIYTQRYSSDGTASGNNFKVNDNEGSAYQGSPSISMDGNGNFVITWQDHRNGDFDIYAQRYSSDGTASGSNFKVNDDEGSAGQFSPSISTDDSGNFVITWRDARNGVYDIYAQRYSSDGTLLGSNFKVNDDEESAWQGLPSISTDGSGNFVITWQDHRNGDSNIYAQRYSSNGTLLASNFKVNDDGESEGQYTPSISMDNSGNFIITWQDSRNGDFDIYGQRYSNDGTLLGSNFKVNDDEGNAVQHNLSVSKDEIGYFVVTWDDYRNGDSDIYGQRYSSDGTLLGSNFKVNDDEEGAYQYQWNPSISTDDNGNFVITWEDTRNGYLDIYAQRYSNAGTALGNNFKINDDEGSALQRNSSISMDDSGNFVITWRDERNGDGDIYAQRYLSDGTLLETNFRVTNTGDGMQYSPDVKLWNNRIYNTWHDNRAGGTGFDIWANVLDWENPVAIIDDESLPSAFTLHQNYPNPFNPKTTIRYQLSTTDNVQLAIYNTLGQKVRMLVNEQQTPGDYIVQWDSRDDHNKEMPSGVYIYRITTSNSTLAGKMVLVR